MISVLVAMLSMIASLITILSWYFNSKTPLPGRSQAHLEALLNKMDKVKVLCNTNGVVAASDEEADVTMETELPREGP
jgi:hypothetical protein